MTRIYVILSFQFFNPIFCRFNIQFSESSNEIRHILHPKPIETNMQAFLAKYMENHWYFLEFDICGGGLINWGVIQTLLLRGEGLIERGFP